MFIFYNLIFLVFALIYLPIYLCKRKFHRGFQMRLGILPPKLELNRPIWIHAVSVGEVMAVRKLIEELRIAYPNKRFLISTVTPTGNKIARGIARDTDFVSYFPLDLSFIVRRVIGKVKPSLFIIMETEIWPNLISYLYRKNIPIILVNGRISDRSFRGYRSIKFLLKPLLDKINLFCVQTEVDAERLICLGVLKNRIKITGNMKFDIQVDFKKTSPAHEQVRDYTDYKLKLGLKQKEKLLVAGSTHAGEEEIILGVYKNLLKEFPYLRLLIAPRHPERANQIEKLVLKNGFQSVLISNLQLTPHAHPECSNFLSDTSGSRRVTTPDNFIRNAEVSASRSNTSQNNFIRDNPKPVFILDTVGQLLSFYALVDIVFVGGSLIKKGGHNILEPASLGKPIIFGPYMFNFRDIASLFLENKAAVSVRNKEELEINIRGLLNNPSRITELSQRAKALVLQNQGATARNLEYISNYL